LRPHEVEELQADGGDAAEVAGAVLPLQDAAELLDLDPGLEAGRVDLLERRCEEDVRARVLSELRVARLVVGLAL
jgi:hypothetical protein